MLQIKNCFCSKEGQKSWLKSNLGWENYTFFSKINCEISSKGLFRLLSRFVHARARAVGCNVSKPDLVYIFAHESLGKWSLETVLLSVGGGNLWDTRRKLSELGQNQWQTQLTFERPGWRWSLRCGPKTESFSIAETEVTLKQLFTCHKLGICNHLVDAHEYIGSCNLERKNSHLSDTISGNMVYMTSPNLDDYW